MPDDPERLMTDDLERQMMQFTPEQIAALGRFSRALADAMCKQSEAWDRAFPGIQAAVAKAKQHGEERRLLRRFPRLNLRRYRGDLNA